jgi:ABC-2 type transport system ATP-binding protein
METAIKIEKVAKSFKLPHEKHTSFKSSFVNLLRPGRRYEMQQALKGVSFEVKKGEFFGVVGRNGSGKSTLLKLLAGIYQPTSGNIDVNGQLTPFIELGVGFNPELTGRENIFLNGALLGFSRKQMKELYSEIVSFAELEKFTDQKLKNYSSGMQVRLAFSIAIKANSDILLLDEVLAVGDAAFQKKCFDYFHKLKKDKVTVVFISHDMNAIREYCDRAVLIEGGKIVEEGSPEKVAQAYTKMFIKTGSVAGDMSNRWGTKKAEAGSVKIKVNDELVEIDVAYRFKQAVDNPIFGLSIFSPVGVKVFESNTQWQHVKTGEFKKASICRIKWQIPNIFTNGSNYVTVAAADSDGAEFYDWWDEAASFIVDRDTPTTAATSPNHKIEIKR